MAIQDFGGRNEGQKYKSLLVWQILLRHTDENHPLTAQKIVDLLQDYGVSAGVHSVCRDIKELQRLYEEEEEEGFLCGERLKYKIEYDGSGERGYKITQRPCSLSDLQLLVECVCSSRFITKEQEKRLLSALTEQCSEHQEDELKRVSYLIDRVKNRNNRLSEYVQTINRAIRNGNKIKFRYMKYTLQNRTEQTPRRKGVFYELSPFKIMVTDGNFYLLAYNGKKVVNYRIDRMSDVEELPEPREGDKVFEKVDLRTYTKRVFSMYGGEEKKVQIRFTNDLLDTVIDRFGADDVFYTPTDDNHFTVSAEVEVSNMFYSWVCSFRKKATIVNPPEVVEGFQQFLNDIQGRYEKGDEICEEKD